MSTPFSRRRFLRGFGTIVSLPALEAFSPGSVQAAKVSPGMGANGLPLRMAWIYSPNGKNMAHWTPASDGPRYEMTRALKPLEKFKADMQVISGLEHAKARANGDGGGDHARANATFLTGCQARKTAGADIKLGVSVDQVAASQIGHLARLPSLELSCDEARRAGNCDSGYSCSYQFNLSWSSENTPLSPERDPRLAFERLFSTGGGKEQEEARARREFYDKSVLDFVVEDGKALQKHLGYRDRQKLDEYLTSIREIERRMTDAKKFNKLIKLPTYQKPAGIPQKYTDHIRLMFDMMWLAFQSDSTRIATFMLAHDGSNRSFPDLGVPDNHHAISHHQQKPENLEKIAKIDEYYSEQFAYFLDKLKATKEGNGTLLDNCMIVFGGGISDPDLHSHDNLPVILAGGGAGLRKGRHFRLKESTPMTNLYLSLLEKAGVEATQIGDSTGKLAGI